MDAYKCAYRDSKSPLTPLAPMNKSAFDFSNILSNSSTKPKTPTSYALTPYSIVRKSPNVLFNTPVSSKTTIKKKIEYTKIENGASSITKYEEYVVKETINIPQTQQQSHQPVRTVQQNTKLLKPISSSASNFNQQSKSFKQVSSPMVCKPLCEDVAQILIDTGLSKYLKLFEIEEIDYEVFKILTENDLIAIGIKPQIDRDIILNAIRYWSHFY